MWKTVLDSLQLTCRWCNAIYAAQFLIHVYAIYDKLQLVYINIRDTWYLDGLSKPPPLWITVPTVGLLATNRIMARSKCCFNVWIVQIFGFVEISVSHIPWHQYIFVYHFLVNHKHVIQSIFCSLSIHRNHFGKLQVFSLVVCMQYYNHTLMSLSICFGK